jgi:hypothetical protein
MIELFKDADFEEQLALSVLGDSTLLEGFHGTNHIGGSVGNKINLTISTYHG